MKVLRTFFVMAVLMFAFSSCSYRLIDFTVISSKNAGIKVEEGKQTEGKSIKFLGLGASIKDAMDDALQNAGSQYDMLIDGVVRVKSYPFISGYVVEGKAVKSGDIKIALGMSDREFENWARTNSFDPKNAEVQEEESN